MFDNLKSTKLLYKEGFPNYPDFFVNPKNFFNTLKVATVCGLSVILAACASSPSSRQYSAKSFDYRKRPQVVRVPFAVTDIKQSATKTMLVGRVFLFDRRLMGERYGPYIYVILNPVSSASTQWFNEVCKRGRALVGSISPEYAGRMAIAKTNKYGQYAFAYIRAGEYYLTTRVYWMDVKPMSGPVQYGGLLAKRVSLQQATNSIDLTDQDRCQPYYSG